MLKNKQKNTLHALARTCCDVGAPQTDVGRILFLKFFIAFEKGLGHGYRVLWTLYLIHLSVVPSFISNHKQGHFYYTFFVDRT